MLQESKKLQLYNQHVLYKLLLALLLNIPLLLWFDQMEKIKNMPSLFVGKKWFLDLFVVSLFSERATNCAAKFDEDC